MLVSRIVQPGSLSKHPEISRSAERLQRDAFAERKLCERNIWPDAFRIIFSKLLFLGRAMQGGYPPMHSAKQSQGIDANATFF